jgi:hypothetical protein
MEVPPEMADIDAQKSAVIEQTIYEQIERLEKVCDYITSCRVILVRSHLHPPRGLSRNAHRVDSDMTNAGADWVDKACVVDGQPITSRDRSSCRRFWSILPFQSRKSNPIPHQSQLNKETAR